MQAPLQARNDSNIVQTKTARTVTQERRLVHDRPTAVAQHNLAEMMNSSPRVLQQRALSDEIYNSARMVTQRHEINALFGGAVQLQKKDAPPAELSPVQLLQRTAEPAPNSTGLPDQLKAGIESLSGIKMDGVRVHYNSGTPSQLNAHAYAQGADIHISPGQERHLAHEAWHVVQQAQGRVKPTMQMKRGISVNDELALENEADVMGAKAVSVGHSIDSTSAVQKKPSSQVSVIKQNQVAQLERLYDETLSPHKAKLLQWLVEENRTLGLSQAGDSGTTNANKKSNFSWHHILPFADLSLHGEGKTAPANHGGNVRLGPMKNRFEASDVSGGTSVDYSYLPLDGENIVLDDYSKGIFDAEIKATDKSSLTAKLTPMTYAKTPQAENFTEGTKADVFGEWFLEMQVKEVLLSKGLIAAKLIGADSEEIDRFVGQITRQFDSLLRTYKYYNKKKEIQTTSGVPMTDISEGNFGHIVIKNDVEHEEIKASTIIDELLRDRKWVKRGSQGVIQNESTTYRFGIAQYAPFTLLVENAARAVDLTNYQNAKIEEFKSKLVEEFEIFRGSGKENTEFDEGKEIALIGKLADTLKAGSFDYNSLWRNVSDNDVKNQYVKVKLGEAHEDWPLPVPEVTSRRSVITETKSSGHSEVSEAWAEIFVGELDKWDKKTPLFDEDSNPEDQMYIDFFAAEESISENEQSWKISEVNGERQKNGYNALPKTFLAEKITINSVKDAMTSELNDNREKYLSSEKEELSLGDVRAELMSGVNAHFNVFSKRLRGVEKDLVKRKLAFGANFEGFVHSAKWNIINSTTMPTDVEGTAGKKWVELGGAQQALYNAWLEQGNVATLISQAVTSAKFVKFLP